MERDLIRKGTEALSHNQVIYSNETRNPCSVYPPTGTRICKSFLLHNFKKLQKLWVNALETR